MFVNDSERCLDTDRDGLADGDKYNSRPWMDRDDDGDGMSDHWELEWNDYALEHGIEYQFDTKNRSDGAEDWDNDGRNNSREYFYDSNPFVADTPKEKAAPFLDSTLISIIVGLIIFLILLFLFLNYAMIYRSKAREQRINENVLETINTNPGITLQSLSKELELRTGALGQHLKVLEGQAFIRSRVVNRQYRFYPASSPVKKKLKLDKVQARILTEILNFDGISSATLAKRLSMTNKVVNHNLKLLANQDVVRLKFVGKKCKCYYKGGLEFQEPVKSKPSRRRGGRGGAKPRGKQTGKAKLPPQSNIRKYKKNR